MAFEIKLFGTSLQIGSFGFFDLMDAVPAAPALQTSADVVVDFQAKPVRAQFANDEGAIKTAA